MTRYDAIATRDGKWWMISIPSVDGLTQARRLSDATEMAREYIAVSQDIPLDAVGVDLRFAPIGDVDDVTDRVATIVAERRQAAALEAEAIARATDLAHDLVAAEVPIRDIGAILGISHQRVHQLTSTR